MAKKFHIAFILCIVCIMSLILGTTIFAKVNASQATKFSQEDALAKLLKNHPDFPKDPNKVLTKQVGPVGKRMMVNVNFNTKVENISKDTFKVTLSKTFDVKVDNEQVKSYWIYKVTANGIDLLESKDNDELVDLIK